MVKVNEKVLKEILLDVDAYLSCRECAFEGKCGINSKITCADALYKLLTENPIDK